MKVHRNAKTTPKARALIVQRVDDGGPSTLGEDSLIACRRRKQLAAGGRSSDRQTEIAWADRMMDRATGRRMRPLSETSNADRRHRVSLQRELSICRIGAAIELFSTRS